MMHIHDKVIAALKRQTTMEKAIEYLRTLNFIFVEGFARPDFEDLTDTEKRYSWMVRKIKGNKFDWSIRIGIKMWGKKTSKLIIDKVVFNEEKWETDEMPGRQNYWVIRIPWKDKADINFRKIVVKLKFPEYLNYEERRTWRTEYHKQKNNPQRVPSEWYLKILPDIQFI